MNGVDHVNDVDLKVLDLQADLPLLERWLRSPHVVRWWGTQDLHLTALAQRSKDSHAVITADGRQVGYLCWQRSSPAEFEAAGLTDLPEDLVDIDILIGEPEFLGRGVGPRAMVLLLARLGGEGVRFAGVGTSISNRPAIRAFEKAGFRLFRDFEDPESGPCRYMVAQLHGAVEAGGSDGRPLHGRRLSQGIRPIRNEKETAQQRIERVTREEVAIAPYDPAWAESFRRERDYLRSCLPTYLIRRIEHFGSTAVPGLAAKPIVDILIEVTDLQATRGQIAPLLEGQGYEYFWRPTHGDDGPPYYAWFIKREARTGARTHHIHMVEGHFTEHWDRLLFRNYLIDHPEIAKEYAALKSRLASTSRRDRVGYTRGKTDFIVGVTERAKRYYGRA